MNRSCSVLALVLCLLFVAACGPPLEATQSTSTSPPPTVTTFEVGETVQIGDYKITINKVRRSSGTEYFKPESGHIWYIAECTLENIGKESKVVSSILMFTLVDKDGRSMKSVLWADTKGSLDGELGVGRKMTGEAAWEVSIGTKGLELLFKPELLQKGQAIFRLGDL